MDEAGKVLAKRRLPEGVAGIAQLHELIGRHLGEDAGAPEVMVGIETDRGPWVTALVAAGYVVFPVNPVQASRYRDGHAVSGAKSDGGDAHVLADMVRTDSHQLRQAAGDSPGAEAVKVLARTHKTLIWERTRAVQRLRHQLREYFPGRAGGLRGPGRLRHPRAAGQGSGPGPRGAADPRAGVRRAQARPPPRHRGEDGRHPRSAAR
jgi:Transposase